MAYTPKPIRRAMRQAFKRSQTCTRLTAFACRWFWDHAYQPD